MVEKKVVVNHGAGLHARPASLFVQAAKQFASDITVKNLTAGGEAVDAKSIIGVLTLGVLQGHQTLIRADGADAKDAVGQLGALVERDFGEA